MTIAQYVERIQTRYKTGISREHSYRGDLQTLLETIAEGVLVTNEPSRIACGAPDYIITRNEIPLGYIEAKDVGIDLQSKSLKEQFDRYRSSLNNLIFTDYLDFRLYIDGEFVTATQIAEIKSGQIVQKPENFAEFTNLIKNFCTHVGQTIKSSKKLAEMMAAKARMLSDVIEKALTSDEENQDNSTLKEQMVGFKQILIHDIKPKEFADIYAQTIAYGMFAARLHDPTLATFSRQEAAELIPKTNPFLRKLFGYIAGPDIDSRIKWIVDALADIFRATDIAALLKNFGKATQMQDPIIHFYETFLAEYDPKLRKARGVWYTPEPVVNFIVRAVDDILKDEFGLPQGLADTSKTTIKLNTQNADKRSSTGYKQVEQEVHRVQILDPATGTGTFLAEVVKHIYKKFEGQQGIWSNYVANHLIPRLNGFELLMASYAMAHLKLDLLLTETGFKSKNDKRFNIYLTNSLEEHHQDTGTLFANWLSSEANEANRIKRDTPVMCIVGNPPYSVSSTNKGKWIESLTADYKKNLKERNIQPLSDDYIKFIRFGQHFIDKNGSGILAYISNNSFIDGLIHREMRKDLLKSFDKIYILDLHGNSKKKEATLEGGLDQNVFDIMQGVSINIFVKTGKKQLGQQATVLQHDLYGKREVKYSFLDRHNLSSINWTSLNSVAPNYFFTVKNFAEATNYEKGFKLDKLFNLYASGIKTERDSICIHFDDQTLNVLERDFLQLDPEEFRSRFTPKPDGRDWKVSTAREDLLKNEKVKANILYRPFDIRRTIYTGKSKGFHSYPRPEIMKHLLKPNYALIFERSATIGEFTNVFVSNCLVECHALGTAFSFGYTAPLYLYPTSTGSELINSSQPQPNLDSDIISKFTERISVTFSAEKGNSSNAISPLDLLDYIYATLHSPAYREKYKEFLKIDFPRVPYPKDRESFWQLVRLGGEIRQIHLLESPIVEKYITQYPVDGSNVMGKVNFQNGNVYINDTQYFSNVPEVAWNFYIGGYQPAQKWLKDRKGYELSFEDILHYQKIIVALTETDRLMKEIDQVLVLE
ncbi:type ISP restriction/modification enzyme [Desertivirga arenae]|uniref:type ISP restriction/modification enzyme n=1 Tax=Desertivirga arenae TaxID=2810309 RepID=UPI001A9612C3|nr:type ISP restriction/modification enzyme [Pedobacter sp. SYSU D00823]